MTDPALAFNHPAGHGRFYKHPAGRYQAVPSITNVMRRQNKPAINCANVRNAAEFAVDNRERLAALTRDEQVRLIKGTQYEKSEASVVGDIVHGWIERYAKRSMGLDAEPVTHDEVTQASNSARWTWESFIKFVQRYQPKWTGIEFTVWSNKHGYAGTMDNSFMIGGYHVLADTKTGKAVHPETAMQLAAGANADFMFDDEGHERAIPQYDRFAVLHLRPRSYSLVPMENIPAAWETFLALKRVFDWELTYATQTVLGAPKYN
jgi:hypothetical protein